MIMQEQAFDSVMHALADPTRRAIVDRLTAGPACVTDLATPFSMSLNAVSKHIKVLEHAGLVHRTQQGREHTLELDPTPLREVARWASRYEQFWNEQLDRLESYFKKKGKS
jgi:DNA-binding transcriptional ArsR family regulator